MADSRMKHLQELNNLRLLQTHNESDSEISMIVNVSPNRSISAEPTPQKTFFNNAHEPPTSTQKPENKDDRVVKELRAALGTLLDANETVTPSLLS